jgi:hypothetical protein
VVETEELPSFAAVAVAGLGSLPDTIGTRSIIIEMRRRAPDEHVDPFRSRKEADAAGALRAKLAGWCQHIAKHIDLDVSLPDNITDRNADCWEPLFAIAEQAGEDWPQRCAEAALFLIGRRKEHVETDGTRLLADLKEVFDVADKMHTATLLLKLENLPESPWKDIKGKPLCERGLASRLKPFGVKSKDVWIGGVTKKGYVASELRDAWNRYLAPKGDEGDEGEEIDYKEQNPSPPSAPSPQVRRIGEGRGGASPEFLRLCEEAAAIGNAKRKPAA